MSIIIIGDKTAKLSLLLVVTTLLVLMSVVSPVNARPRLRNGTYEIKEGSILGQDWKLATVTLELQDEEELYFPELVPCMGCASTQGLKKNNRGEVCVCDFSKTGDNCGKAPSGCPSDTCSRSDINKFCKDSRLHRWRTIKYNENKKKDYVKLNDEQLDDGEAHYYRLPVTEKCLGILIKAYLVSGIVDIFASTDVPEPDTLTAQKNSVSQRFPDHIEINYCPEESRFGFGTIFLKVLGRTNHSVYDLVVFTQESNPSKEAESETNELCSDESDVVCLKEEVASEVSFEPRNSLFKTRYDFKARDGECINFAAYLRVESGDGHLYGAWDYSPDWKTYEYGAYYQGSDSIFFQKCFEKKGTYRFYLSVRTWMPGLFYLTVSTRKEAFYLPSTTFVTPYQYGYSIRSSFKVDCPGVTLACDNWGFSCKEFWNIYPSVESDPFWPLPVVWTSREDMFSKSLFLTLRTHDTPLIQRRLDRIVLVVVMETDIFKRSMSYLTEDQVSKCTYRSLGRLFDSDGKALQGKVGAKKIVPKCKEQQVEEVIKIGRQYTNALPEIREDKDFEKIIRYGFQVNTLQFSTAWIACANYADSLLNQTVEVQPVASTLCVHTNTSSPEYLSDPCCNNALLAYYCCSDRMVNLLETEFLNIDNKDVNEDCFAPNCVKSYLKDYLTSRQEHIACATFNLDDYPKLSQTYMSYYIQCKQLYKPDGLVLGNIKCYNDAQCTILGVPNKCNLVTNRCIGSYEYEKIAAQCFPTYGFDLFTTNYFKYEFDLPGQKTDPEFMEAFAEAFTEYDCVNIYGDPQPMRKRSTYVPSSTMCESANTFNCTTTECLDDFCLIQPTSCIGLCGMEWIETPITEKECKGANKCNYLPEICSIYDDSCEERCDKLEKYSCAYCADEAHCIKIPGINSEEECQNTEACYLPDGTIELMSREECLALVGCDRLCNLGFSCESASNNDNLCTSPTITTFEECDGTWRDDLGLCTYPHLSASLCELSGNVFQTCKGLSIPECGSCYKGTGCSVNQELLQCHIVPRSKCPSNETCSFFGGYCDDVEYYKNYGGAVTDSFGACVGSMTYSPDSFPQCYDQMTPDGCYNGQYIPMANCTNGHWHALGTNILTCQYGNMGCQNYFSVRNLSPMNSTVCRACGFTPSTYFNWYQGVWMPATPITLQWQKAKVVPAFSWEPSIKFGKLSGAVTELIDDTFYADLMTQMVCDFNVKSGPIEAVSCACRGDHHECFKNSYKEVANGVVRPCIGGASQVSSPISQIFVGNLSVPRNASDRCVEVAISTISMYTLEQPNQVAFSPLMNVRDYDQFNIVLNDDDAIIGRVMSDGVILSFDGKLHNLTLCIKPAAKKSSAPDKFEVWDLGIKRNKEFLKPLNAKMINVTIESLRLQRLTGVTLLSDMKCFLLKKPVSQTYHLIVREKHYENDDGSLYQDEAIAWWIFAAMYAALAAWSFLIVVLHFFGFRIHYYFIGLFVFLMAMCIIRSIYFFLLGSGYFDDGSSFAGAYLLIELPTLLYFTAFSCLAAFWLFLIYASINSRKHKWILIATLFFNSILYLLFVVFIILFETLPSSSESECPGRIAAEEDNTNQKIVSVVYQAFMAGVSLFLAIVVLLLGGKLLSGLKNREFEKKIALVTVICALGLLLHCAFILYLSATLKYNFTLIVLMIVLSELLPIPLIAIQFSILRVTSKMPSYNKKANFFKALAFWRTDSRSPGVTLGTGTTARSTKPTLSNTTNTTGSGSHTPSSTT